MGALRALVLAGRREETDEDSDKEDEGDTGALAVARLGGFGDSFYLT